VIVWDRGSYEKGGIGTLARGDRARPRRLRAARQEALRRLRPGAVL